MEYNYEDEVDSQWHPGYVGLFTDGTGVHLTGEGTYWWSPVSSATASAYGMHTHTSGVTGADSGMDRYRGNSVRVDGKTMFS